MRFCSAKTVSLTMLLALLALSVPRAGAQQNETMQQIVARCDQLTASPNDPERKAEGVEFEEIDTTAAIDSCGHAVQLQDVPRIQYQYGRSLHKGKFSLI